MAEPLPPLPAIEEITAETDVSIFLRKGVADALRNAALRKMWSLDPAIRDYVGDARDYAYDWNVPGGVPGFGPIEPGYDVAGTLSRMFSRTGPDPADEAEPQAEPEPEPGLSAAQESDLLPSPPDAEDPVLEPAEIAAAGARDPAPHDPAEPAQAADAGEASQRPSRLRHGGAAPS